MDKRHNTIKCLPDQLAQDATMAIKLGLSYGKYKALQLENRLPKPKQKMEPEKESTEQEKDEANIKRCAICGRPITSGFRRKYCTDECAMKANRENAKNAGIGSMERRNRCRSL